MNSRIMARWLPTFCVVVSSLIISCGKSSDQTSRADGSLADTKVGLAQADVLSTDLVPDIWRPSDADVDCRTSKDSYCVYAAILMNGEASSLLCLSANKDLVSRSKKQFSFRCTSATASRLAFMAIGPEKGEGAYSVGFADAQASDSTLELLDVTDDTHSRILSSRAANISDATLSWTESAGGSYVGSFSGTWSSPIGGCSYFGYQCAEGSVRGTFKFTWQ